jgi:hypothetical protein
MGEGGEGESDKRVNLSGKKGAVGRGKDRQDLLFCPRERPRREIGGETMINQGRKSFLSHRLYVFNDL